MNYFRCRSDSLESSTLAKGDWEGKGEEGKGVHIFSPFSGVKKIHPSITRIRIIVTLIVLKINFN